MHGRLLNRRGILCCLFSHVTLESQLFWLLRLKKEETGCKFRFIHFEVLIGCEFLFLPLKDKVVPQT